MKRTLGFNPLEFSKFKRLLKKMLSDNGKVDDAILEKQIALITQNIIDFQPYKVIRRYKKEVRLNNESFFSKMSELVLAKTKFVDNSTIYIKIPMSTAKGSKEIKFDIPVSHMGSKHLAEATLEFLYKYYEEYPPFKYIKGLDQPICDDFILKQATKYKSKNYLNNKIIMDSEELSFILLILSLIKSFPQFPKPQRENSALTEMQGEFIIRFLHIINYREWKKTGYGVIRPNFSELRTRALSDDIITLRNSLKAYLNNFKKTPNSIL